MLVSVAIISVVGLALLQMNANNTAMVERAEAKHEINTVISLAGTDLGLEDDRSDKEPYELYKKRFGSDDAAKELLGGEKFTFAYEEEFAVIDLFEGGMGESDEGLEVELEEDEEAMLGFRVLLQKASFNYKESGGYYYRLKMGSE